MQSLRFLAAMATLGAILLTARAVAPHQINTIAVYDAMFFVAIGIVACVVGIARG